ncbi:MAG: M14 family metallopeptidase [Bacteroidales bacterium]
MKYRLFNILFTLVAAGLFPLFSQEIPSPKEHFGFNIGDDYMLATYTQTEAYFKKLDESERAKLVDIGMTEEGRHQYMLIISSPENMKNLERYRDISIRLARAEGLSDDDARRLAEEGRAVVWIDGGLHATEVVGTHQLIETAWQLASRNDKETLEILDNVIVLLVHANPDGQELVSSWYMRESDTLKRSMNIPRLYQKYIGHDNNRDFFMMSMKETRNMARQLYIDWIPQILYNHHQSGPAGTVLAGPPYRDPFNYRYDPILVTTIDALGAAMNNRLNAEGKPGATQRTGASFSTWYNGGLRTTAYFHNIAGLLTEITGSPTPSEIPLVVERLLPSGATPYPVTPRKWHFRQSIDYSVSLNYAVLDYASRHRNEVLYNIYRMGMNSIERGSCDYVTVSPKIIENIRKAYEKDNPLQQQSGQRLQSQTRIPLKYYEQVMNDTDNFDPRVYIIPYGQKDFPAAVRFVNALLLAGIQVYKAEADFTVNNKTYQAGSYIIKTAQAFRPHILDMFEPQDHPNDLQYPGGPPIPPYDAAGWTLAMQMGIEFDRLFTDIDGAFIKIPTGEVEPFPAQNLPAGAIAGYLLSPQINNSFIVVNDLLSGGIEVFRVAAPGGKAGEASAGDFFVPALPKAKIILARSITKNGVKVRAAMRRPGNLEKITCARTGICDRYGGSMQTGWMRWILEQYNFPYRLVYSQGIDSGNLRSRFDILIFPSGVIPEYRETRQEQTTETRKPAVPDNIPEEYKSMSGSITAAQSIPQLRKFLEDGGTIIVTGTSTSLAYYLGLPVSNALVKKDESGREVSLSNTEFFIPGSLLKVGIDTTRRDAWGMPGLGIVYFNRSQVFRLNEDAEARGVRKILWFTEDKPLASGWALGQDYLKNGVVGFTATAGKGILCAYGPDITFRSQSQMNFRLLFNRLYNYQVKR